jgi:hypothetical protein
MTAIMANPATPLYIAVPLIIFAVWMGWTAARLSFNAPADDDPEETT